MNKILLLSLSVLLLNFQGFCKKKSNDKNQMSLLKAVQAINLNYDIVLQDSTIKAYFDTLDEVSVNFKVGKTTNIDGTINVLIFEIGKSRERTKTSSVTFNFAKPKPNTLEKSLDLTTKDRSLADFIIISAREFIDLKETPTGTLKDNIEFEVSFGIESVGDGGFKFELFNVELGGKHSRKNLAEHTLKLKLTRKKI